MEENKDESQVDLMGTKIDRQIRPFLVWCKKDKKDNSSLTADELRNVLATFSSIMENVLEPISDHGRKYWEVRWSRDEKQRSKYAHLKCCMDPFVYIERLKVSWK